MVFKGTPSGFGKIIFCWIYMHEYVEGLNRIAKLAGEV
jgi:hypothetical protein